MSDFPTRMSTGFVADAIRSVLWQNVREFMRRFHLIFGIVLFVVFLVTGQFMRAHFPDKDIIPQDFRLLMRSRHIYILFCAFLHILLGVYITINPGGWRKIVQYAGSAMLIASGILLAWAFAAETYTFAGFSEISRFGIYTSLAGVSLHLITGMRKREGE